ncbi:ImmA/IrrE family metallo-endopeptidase [Paenarthrobacter nicotinovorans]|uniref:ImmA/IrrE family metallo-endopeptidase n=1 Tax=Paenarthrobacter nicotinovorans TaxID=29320 RepID=UPI00382AFE11
MYHPWRTLRTLNHIRLSLVKMPDGGLGRTNGVDAIWLDKRQQQVERRCTLTHELVHIEHRHTECQPPAIEREVRAEAARRLIRFTDLLRHLAWARSFHELADELWVTEGVLADRVNNLTPEEWAAIEATEKQGDHV